MKCVATLLCLVAAHVLAWEFTPSPICTLSDQASATSARLTYDGQIYTLTLSHPDGWPPADVFSIQFAPQGPFISTSRHIIDGMDLTVSDVGFGNVLIGLEVNTQAIAILGELTRPISLDGAREPVRAFRDCDPGIPSA